MESTTTPFFYISDNPAYVSYRKPIETLRKNLDFSKSIINYNDDSIFDDVKEIVAVIEEVHNDYLTLNCLIDRDKRIFQKRKFDKAPFNNTLDLFEGEGVNIKIMTRSGMRVFSYSKCEVPDDFFEEPEDLFSSFRGTCLFPEK